MESESQMESESLTTDGTLALECHSGPETLKRAALRPAPCARLKRGPMPFCPFRAWARLADKIQERGCVEERVRKLRREARWEALFRFNPGPVEWDDSDGGVAWDGPPPLVSDSSDVGSPAAGPSPSSDSSTSSGDSEPPLRSRRFYARMRRVFAPKKK